MGWEGIVEMGRQDNYQTTTRTNVLILALDPAAFHAHFPPRLEAQAKGEGPISVAVAAEVRVRSVTRMDFEEALKMTLPSTHKADEYRARVGYSVASEHGIGVRLQVTPAREFRCLSDEDSAKDKGGLGRQL